MNKKIKKSGKVGAKQADSKESTTVLSESYKRGHNPRSLANLTPFQKGTSGNPDGRPGKYVKLAKALKAYGEKPSEGWGNTTNKETVLERIWFEAGMGNIQHIKILAELGCLDDD